MFVHRLKLRRPQLLRAWIERSDVERRFAAGVRVLSIVAGPGYGKTVLAAQIAEAWDGPSFWYELDKADGDVTVFAAHAEAMLQAATVRPEADISRWLGGSPPDVGSVLADGLVDIPRPLVVFDDVHALEGSRALPALAKFIEQGLRAGAAFVLCGRSMPVALHLAAAGGRLATAGPAELVLSTEEARVYLQRTSMCGDFATLEDLARRTEGWPAGLALVASTSPERSAPAGQALETRAEATHEVLYAYLAAEVLDDLPAQHRRLLVETSILDVLESDVCNAVAQTSDAGEILARLATRGSFVSRRTDDAFTTHQLFREFLRHQLDATYAHDDIVRLHARAAEEFKRRGDVEFEIDHRLLGADVPSAAAVLATCAFALLSSGLVESVGAFLERIGEVHVESSATLLAARGRVQQSRGELDAALGSLERAIALARERGEHDVLADSVRVLSPILASRGDFQRPSELLEQSLALPLSQGARARLSVTLAALQLDSGRYEEALRLFDATMPAIVALGDLALQGVVLHNMAAAHVRRGDPYAALALYERALAVKRGAGQRVSALLTVGNTIFVKRTLGDHDGAERLCREMLADAREVGNAAMLAHALENAGSIALARGNLAQATTVLQEARRACDPSDAWFLPDILHRLGEAALAAGDARAADEYCVQAAALLRTTKLPQRLGPVFATRGQCALSLADPARALEFAREALHAARDGPDGVSTATVDLEVAALLVRCIPHLPRSAAAAAERLAASAATEAMALVHEREYRFLFRTKAAFLEPLRPHLSRWRRAGAAAASDAQRRTPALRIEMLGALRVFVAGERLPAEAWKRRKAPMIFAYLVTERERVVSRARLVDLYWPELEADAAHDNLRVTVGAIRKALGDVVKFEANGYRFVAPPDLWIDVHAFDAYVEAGREARSRGDERAVRLAYMKAVDLYGGDFIEGYDDGAWQWRERERLRAAVLEALRWLGSDATRDGVFRRLMLERLLEIAPFETQAVRSRLDLLVSELRLADACREYDDWKRRYRNAVGREPPEIWQAPAGAEDCADAHAILPTPLTA